MRVTKETVKIKKKLFTKIQKNEYWNEYKQKTQKFTEAPSYRYQIQWDVLDVNIIKCNSPQKIGNIICNFNFFINLI